MNKTKEYNYVLVLAPKGPVFVTKVNYGNKTCKWDGEKPHEFSHDDAILTAAGLTFNGTYAMAVCSRCVIDMQPYDYSKGRLVWEEVKKLEEHKEDAQ